MRTEKGKAAFGCQRVHTRKMGQAFRRASGRIRAASKLDARSSPKPKIVMDHRPSPPPPRAPVEKVKISKTARQDALDVGM